MWFKPDFYKSRKWRELRKWALAKYGAKCMKCGSLDDIQVDHILSRSRFPRLRLSKHNVQILCGTCNKKKGSIDQTDYRPMRHKGYYYMIKIITKAFMYAYLALSFAVIFQDVASGGLETSFTGQIIIEAGEVISSSLTFAGTSLSDSLLLKDQLSD